MDVTTFGRSHIQQHPSLTFKINGRYHVWTKSHSKPFTSDCQNKWTLPRLDEVTSNSTHLWHSKWMDVTTFGRSQIQNHPPLNPKINGRYHVWTKSHPTDPTSDIQNKWTLLRLYEVTSNSIHLWHPKYMDVTTFGRSHIQQHPPLTSKINGRYHVWTKSRSISLTSDI